MKAKKLWLVREYDGDGCDSLAEAARPGNDRRTDFMLCLSSVDQTLGKAVAKRILAGKVVEILVVVL